MRILYVSYESPLFPVGGAGTYVEYAAAAMKSAGHSVYLLTWTYETAGAISTFASFAPEDCKIVLLSDEMVRRRYPGAPRNHAVSTYLLQTISQCVDEWRIDVVEATDYLSPALAYFQDVQSRARCRDVLCVTYSHGFAEDFFDADQCIAGPDSQDDFAGERQQCRASDLVVAPSVIAARRLNGHGIVDQVTLIREPYSFQNELPLLTVNPRITYMGRVSLSKGIDKLIYLANVLDDAWRLESILLVGRLVDTQFRTRDIRKYVAARLKPNLRELVSFSGSLSRPEARSLLNSGDVAPHLGSADTFSYACIEAIDNGLLPVVRRATPMAEFFPPDWHHHVFDDEFRDQKVMIRQFDALVRDGPKLVSELQCYNRVELAPSKIAEQTGSQYAQALDAKRGCHSVLLRRSAMPDDVTIAIPAYRPGEDFIATVDSIAGQSTGAPAVVICDDGTPPPDTAWLDYARMRLPKCRVVRQTNGGLLSARNTLVSEIESPLMIFLDVDDLLAPSYVARTLQAYNESIFRPNAVLSGRRNFDENVETVIRDFSNDHMHMLRNDFRMTALVETAVVREIGFDATRRNGEADDWAFWLEFESRGYRSIMLPDTIFYYRFREGSMSWPWSVGQLVGSHSMIRNVLDGASHRRPEYAKGLAKALYSAATVRRKNSDELDA